MSVGFVAGRENQKISERGGRVHRALTGFRKLLDVSPTWEPAYEGTSAELRSLTEAFQQVPALVPEQAPDGEPQSSEGGQHQEDAETVPAVCETCAQNECVCEQEPEEQRSGADAAQAAAAARRRRLQLLGISLPG
jgi:hypothetical protein